MVAPSVEPAVVPDTPDDLVIIEGIGPKISSVLQAAGIITFKQLAEAETESVKQILLAANLRLADPTSWKEQARLAAAADWEGLKALQESLKGGRAADVGQGLA